MKKPYAMWINMSCVSVLQTVLYKAGEFRKLCT